MAASTQHLAFKRSLAEWMLFSLFRKLSNKIKPFKELERDEADLLPYLVYGKLDFT